MVRRRVRSGYTLVRVFSISLLRWEGSLCKIVSRPMNNGVENKTNYPGMKSLILI